MRNIINYSLLILGFVLYFGYTPTCLADTLSYKEGNKTVVLLSMSAKFKITEKGAPAKSFEIQTDSKASGNITHHTNGSVYSIITFIVSWNTTNQFILTFNSTAEKWIWQNSTFVVSHDGYVIVPLKSMISSFGDGVISAERNHSYVCNSPLDFTGNADNIKVSITWNQFQVEVYPKNNTMFDSNLRPCTVDLDDKIVPIAVGGALGLLLLLVVIIYVISYIRDRRQQSKELRSGYNRIDQPEPNHHS